MGELLDRNLVWVQLVLRVPLVLGPGLAEEMLENLAS